MPLVVEDGTGLPNADSYASREEFLSYRTAMYATSGSEPVEAVDAALRRATRYIDANYAFVGYPTHGSQQALAWPRTVLGPNSTYVYALDYMPREVKNATIEAAIRELASPGSLLADENPSQRVIRQKVGPIETQYSDRGAAQVRITLIDRMISDLVSSSGGSMTVFALRA